MAEVVNEWYFDEAGKLRKRKVEDVPPTPDYVTQGKAVYLRAEAREDDLKMFTPLKVMGMLSLSKNELKRVRKKYFEPWQSIRWLNHYDWRVAAWAVKRFAQYEGRCPNCGKRYQRHFQTEDS